MGLDYGETVDSIVEKREGAIFAIRFQGERHHLDIVEPDELPARSALAAHLRRKLETTFRRG